VTAEIGRVSFGTWGSHGFDGAYSEQDLWASYTFPAAGGEVALSLVDY